MHLSDLKHLHVTELVDMAAANEIENANRMRKQDLIFALLKNSAKRGESIFGDGTLEVLPDGFGFLRSPDTSYLAGPDDIYVSPSQIRRFNLHTGDSIEGEIRTPKEGERYFALVKVDHVNGEPPENAKHKILFENLIALNAGLDSFAKNCSGGDKLPQTSGTDGLLSFGRKGLQDSGLPSRDSSEMSGKMSSIDLNRDDKAHRFVVTWNAFQDGNRLAYLALAIAIAIDSLVFMSGLFGANAIRSPLGEISISFQNARCRACNGSFSPSKQNMVAARRSAPDARRRAPCRA